MAKTSALQVTSWDLPHPSKAWGCTANWLRSLAAVMGISLLGVASGPISSASAAELRANGGAKLAAAPLLGPDLPGLEEGQAQAAEVARLSPEAFAIRQASQTRFAEESGQEAAGTLVASFPTYATASNGGPPSLPAGVTAAGFAGPSLEKLAIGSQYGGVLQSSIPMALEVSPSIWEPVNLELREEDGGFAPAAPIVDVRLPRHLSEGALLKPLGISLTPVDAGGRPLSGADGVKTAATELFANTGVDSDTILKPTSLGIDASTVLRSVSSPRVMYYKIGLPAGAHLEPSRNGGIHVVKEGSVVAELRAPHAVDAAGTPVPTTMIIDSGDVAAVTADHKAGAFQYPILVDPEFTDVWENEYKVGAAGPWVFGTAGEYETHQNFGGIQSRHTGMWPAEDWAAWTLIAPGYTSVYEMKVSDLILPATENNTPKWLEAWMEIINPGGGRDEFFTLTGTPYVKEHTLCVPGCNPESAPVGNGARFEVNTKESGGPEPWEVYSELSVALVETISAEHHSSVAYNRTSSELPVTGPPYNTPNVLYPTGSKRWLGPYGGAFEITATDKGLGVFESGVELNTSSGWKRLNHTNWKQTSGCEGDICVESEHEELDYALLTEAALPEGEDTIRAFAQSAMPYSSSNEAGGEQVTLKVDAAPPHSLTFSGLTASKGEYTLGETPVHVQAEATDGSGTTPSSGIAEISLLVDGRKIGSGGGQCQPGPCTGAAQWTLNGSEIGSGDHILEVEATDNAGNVASPLKYGSLVMDVGEVRVGV